jgi:hypothetical protein
MDKKKLKARLSELESRVAALEAKRRAPRKAKLKAAAPEANDVHDFVRPSTDFKDFEEAFAPKTRPWDNHQIGARCETIATGGKFLR